MTLIIEDGSIVANANSFTTDAELVAYAAERGLTVPATESERDQLQIRGVDYLTSQEDYLNGVRVSSVQELIYPRSGVYINGFAFASDDIPKELKYAQMEAAIAANTQDLLVNGQGQNIESEKVDVLEISYFSGGSWDSVRLDRVNAYLNRLLKNTSGQLVRI